MYGEPGWEKWVIHEGHVWLEKQQRAFVCARDVSLSLCVSVYECVKETE